MNNIPKILPILLYLPPINATPYRFLPNNYESDFTFPFLQYRYNLVGAYDFFLGYYISIFLPYGRLYLHKYLKFVGRLHSETVDIIFDLMLRLK